MAYDRKAAAAKARGLAPRALSKHFKPGAVFAARDGRIALPEELLDGAGARLLHTTRRVIVVQSREFSMASMPRTILVVPCSASSIVAGTWDIKIPDGEDGFDKPGIVAFASLIQPLLKIDLVEFKGQLCDETLLLLQQAIARNVGIIAASALRLPTQLEVPAPSNQPG